MRVENGFVWRTVIQRVGRPCGGVLAGHARKAVCKAIGSVLFDDLFGLDLQFFMQRDEGVVVGERESPIERGGTEAGFEARDAEQVVLGEGDAFEGEGFLRVLRLIDGNEVGAETVDGVAVLDFDDSEGFAGEPVFAGVLCRTGFA